MTDEAMVLSAYKTISKEGSFRFDTPEQQAALGVFEPLLPERVDIYLSPLWDFRRPAAMIAWCNENLGDALVTYHEPITEIMEDGRSLLTRRKAFNPEGRWEILRRTFFFREVDDAMWFKMVWW